jgi:uncharacterized protein YybS (DUF2232 family)
MPNNQSKQLAHGAMMVAMFTVLFVIGLYVPVISIFAIAFSPVPIAWYSAKYKTSASLLVVVTALVISLIVGGIISLPTAVMFTLLGLVIGSSVRNKKSKLNMFISTTIAMLVSICFMYAFLVVIFSVNVVKEFLNRLKENMDVMAESAEKLGGAITYTPEQLASVYTIVETVIPAVVIIGSAVMALIFMNITLAILKRLRVDVPKFQPFNHLRFPKSIVFYYLIVLAISMFVNLEVGTSLYTIVLNFMFILSILLVIQGIALMFYFIQSKGLPTALKFVVVFLTIPLYNFVLLIGVFDIAFNIREFVSDKKTK